MLIWILSALSAVIAVATAVYCGQSWLMVLLASFAASWISLTILALVALAVLCAVVDKDKEQAHDSKLYRFIAHLYISFGITLGRLKIVSRGLEKTPRQGRFLLVCNHLNDIDPAVILHCFPKSQLAFISKKENKNMPIVGAVMHKILCQLIDRENDREALKTILKCIDLVKNDEVSIGVFPEGYVSKDGKLRPLKGGVFKIAQRAGVPIVVCTLRGTKEAMHKLLHLEPSQVELHLVDVIAAEELKGVTATQIAQRVHELMADDLGPALVAEG